MAKFVAFLVLSLVYIQAISAHGDENHERTNETPQEKSNVRVNVPNLLNVLPNFDKLFSDFDFGSSRSEPEQEETPIRKTLKNVRRSYQNIRNTVQSALNLRDDNSDMFNLDLSNKGPKTQLNMNTPLGQLSLDSKSRNEPVEEKVGKSDVEAVSQKPLSKYMSDILQEQAKRLDDFTLNLFGPTAADGSRRNVLSVSNRGDKSNVDFMAPVIPVMVSVASQGAGGFATRTGFPQQPSALYDDRSFEDDWDPELEYNRMMDHQKEKYLEMRSHGFREPQPHSATRFPPPPMSRQTAVHHHFHNDPHSLAYQPHAHGLHSPIYPYLSYPGIRPHQPLMRPPEPYPHGPYIHRDGHLGVPQTMPADPISNQPIKNYHDHRLMTPDFDQAGLRMDLFPESSTLKDEQDNYEEYIKDLQDASNSLNEDTKAKLREAFKTFRKTLDDDESMESGSFEDQDIMSTWLPRRVVDHRDLEVAFMNIDKDSDERPNPSDTVVVAFTLTGVPLKIYVGSNIKNPVQHLHKVLADAGITLNIPVTSYETMEPVSDVLFVGAGNSGNEISEAVSLEVQNLDDIKKSVIRFLRTDQPQISDKDASKAMTEALHEALTSGELRFSDALEENFQRNPVQVLADVVTYLSDPQKENEDDH